MALSAQQQAEAFRRRAQQPQPAPSRLGELAGAGAQGHAAAAPAGTSTSAFEPRYDKRDDDLHAHTAASEAKYEAAPSYGRSGGLLYSKGLDEHGKTQRRVEIGVAVAVFALAALLRFWRIGHPAAVVFDEVHFGKFASYYLRREFFFDVHPALSKLLLAFAGWVVGYDGHYEFDLIGESYEKNHVPYVALRTIPALTGSAVPVVMYLIMRESGYPRIASLVTASLVIFDNAHITQSRLILLDAPMILFMVLAFYSYIRFHKLRYLEFTRPWWTWMTLTGVFLSLTISCKMVGLFAFMTVGFAVVLDLWQLLDVRRGLSIERFTQHFAARAFSLIVVPAVVYLFWFWVHFTVLHKSGTGDEFMSPAFQQTLLESPLNMNAEEIRYFDIVTIRHKQSKAFLHSHVERYPLKYDDGRISSAGQQVTGYPFNDTNNNWQVLPTKEIPERGRGRVVRQKDVVQLKHVNTGTILLTHDVASPSMPTNTEFTTWDGKDEARERDTHFELRIDDAHDGQQWMTKSAHFQLIHTQTKVALFTHTDPPLPEWAFKQQEVNGNKNIKDRHTFWFADEIVRDPGSEDPLRPRKAPRQRRKMSFFRKFFELQVAMLQHNAGLTDSHPYASGPLNWPFLISGISFWTSDNKLRQQVYMVGNIVGWWFAAMAVSVLVGVLSADTLARRRGIAPIPDAPRSRLYNSAGFFLVAWACHYFPFFLMVRQLFLHHYLPAHVCSAFVAGAVFHFICTDTVNYPVSTAGPGTRRRPRQYAAKSRKMVVAGAVVLVLLIAMFHFTSPLTYGYPGLDVQGVLRRKLLSTWTLHFAK